MFYLSKIISRWPPAQDKNLHRTIWQNEEFFVLYQKLPYKHDWPQNVNEHLLAKMFHSLYGS
jgi:hypothetical protein